MIAATIFALSSGMPPAGIAVIRVSGPRAGEALRLVGGVVPEPRVARLCRLRHPASGDTLDHGLTLWFPGPASVTGEDMAEFHVHGGRAVVAAMLAVLGSIDGLRGAEAGEFTRRAFENGRIDLAQAEGLSDLLSAETDLQRRSALALTEGQLGRHVSRWQSLLLRQAASVEARLDFDDEDDVRGDADTSGLVTLLSDIETVLASPPAERLRDGVRVVFAGPPNAGKSSLFNALAGRTAAIVTDIAGTTRDVIEAPLSIDGIPLVLVDTAGLTETPRDAVEAIGIGLTGDALAGADIILWLGAADVMPFAYKAILVAAKADLAVRGGFAVSVVSGVGLAELTIAIVDGARAILPKAGALALNARHRAILSKVKQEIAAASTARDLLIIAEHLRAARNQLDALTGRAGVEDMLDALFTTFCIGK